MILSRFLILFFVSFNVMGYGYTYSDYDVDGVEDSIDICPNTPFDVLVDERGCEEGKNYYGALTLLSGTISAIDSETENLTNALLFINYRYHAWDISFSTFNDIQNTISNVPNTLYVTSGYRFEPSNKLRAKISLGTKQSTLQNDYYLASSFDYTLNKQQNLFLYYSYTVAENSEDENYNNFHTLSFGTGRSLTQYWYSALSYDFSGASLANAEDYQTLSWANTFAFSTKYYFLTNYSYGLSTGASDHTISLQFGVKFE